jgi:hypothetical protein
LFSWQKLKRLIVGTVNCSDVSIHENNSLFTLGVKITLESPLFLEILKAINELCFSQIAALVIVMF